MSRERYIDSPENQPLTTTCLAAALGA